MLPLDSPVWSKLRHAFGSADGTPVVLKRMYDCLAEDPLDQEKYRVAHDDVEDEISSNLFHQQSTYTATAAALPHLLKLANQMPHDDRVMMYFMCAWISWEAFPPERYGQVCAARGEPVPPQIDDLQKWYDAAIAQARIDFVEYASTHELRVGQQEYLFCAIAGIHGTMRAGYAIRDRDCLNFNCNECDAAMECLWEDGEYWLEQFEGEGGQSKSKITPTSTLVEDIRKQENAELILVYETAIAGGHVEFVEWLSKLLGRFKCNACGQESTLFLSHLSW